MLALIGVVHLTPDESRESLRSLELSPHFAVVQLERDVEIQFQFYSIIGVLLKESSLTGP